MMDDIIQDLRYGFRQLVRQRGSSIAGVLTLALGIGASTAIFSVIDAALLRPLPHPDPEQLVTVAVELTQPDGKVSRPTTSMADLHRWEEERDIFSSVAGRGSSRRRIVVGPEVERVQVSQFTEDFLSLHGVSPLMGRGFTFEDMRVGSPPVALLGYGYWQRRYAGRQDVLGETVALDDGAATIVGVLPASFDSEVPLVMPLQVPPAQTARRGTGRVSVYARLLPGVTVEQASERLSARMPSEAIQGSAVPVRVLVSSRVESAINRYQLTINVIAGAVGLVLLLACVNVVGLLLARGAARKPELALRASLGAGRLRLIRQLLAEYLVLTFAGGLVGVGLAWLCLDLIVANIPLSLPANSPVTVNLRVLAASAALLLPTVLLFGLVPAVHLSQVRIASFLARGGPESGFALSRRGGQLLIIAEVSLAIVLVTSAGLMLRSFERLSSVDLGFQPDGLITMEVMPLDREPSAHFGYYAALLHRVRAIHGVESVGLVDNFPLAGSTTYTTLRGSGGPEPASVFAVLPGYHEAIGARLLAGRLPTESEAATGVRSAVINQSAARLLFQDGSAVGRQFAYAYGADRAAWTVLGVIADIRHGGPLDVRNQNLPQVYFPIRPAAMEINQPMMLVVRTSGQLDGRRLTEAARSIGPRVLIERLRAGNDWFGDRVITPRRRTVLLSLLGGLGFALALVGVFAVTAYAVSRRSREIGVRLALGARPAQVVTAILRDSAVPIVIGTALGLGGATVTTRVIQSFLFETTPTDTVTFVTVALTLVTAGGLAALVPAMRATRVDPVATLRAE